MCRPCAVRPGPGSLIARPRILQGSGTGNFTKLLKSEVFFFSPVGDVVEQNPKRNKKPTPIPYATASALRCHMWLDLTSGCFSDAPPEPLG